MFIYFSFFDKPPYVMHLRSLKSLYLIKKVLQYKTENLYVDPIYVKDRNEPPIR